MTDPLNTTTPPPSPSDVLLGRVILALGALGVLTLVGMVLLAALDKPPINELGVALGAIVGALGSVLVGRRA